MKLPERLAPGCGPGTLLLAFVDVLAQHRAASFRLSQRLADQRICMAQRFLLRNPADDRASDDERRASSNFSTCATT
jgi:hypothetical protein